MSMRLKFFVFLNKAIEHCYQRESLNTTTKDLYDALCPESQAKAREILNEIAKFDECMWGFTKQITEIVNKR